MRLECYRNLKFEDGQLLALYPGLRKEEMSLGMRLDSFVVSYGTTQPHRRLQAWTYLGYFESCVLISQGLGTKTSIQHMCACACTDVRIAYSVATKYAFPNCASNVAQPSLARVPTQLCRCLCLVLFSCKSPLQPRDKIWDGGLGTRLECTLSKHFFVLKSRMSLWICSIISHLLPACVQTV